MKKSVGLAIIFALGSVLYGLAELLFRGYTHWTMLIAGGTAFLALFTMNLKLGYLNLFLRCLLGSLIITAIELSVGCVVNILLKMSVWDYSELRFNVLGQICPQFSAVWFFLCIPAAFLSSYIHRQLFGRASGNQNALM